MSTPIKSWLGLIAVAAGAADVKGPSSSQTPYLTSLVPGVSTTSILTVGDAVNVKPDDSTPYRMVGIPNGLGAFDNGDDTFTVLMNHELGRRARLWMCVILFDMKKVIALSLPAIILAAFGYLKLREEKVPPSTGPLTLQVTQMELVPLEAKEINRQYDTKVKVVLQHYGSTPKWWPGNSARPIAIGDTQLVTAKGKIYRTTTGLPEKGLGIYSQTSYGFDATKRQDTFVFYIRTNFLSSNQEPLTFKTKLSYHGKAQQVSVCVRGCS